ncbi:MAG: cytochrome c [Candidatus Obscuribacterales bacterium]|nr:cytochrome c [Candidatus Obscuribacterales bacterium]
MPFLQKSAIAFLSLFALLAIITTSDAKEGKCEKTGSKNLQVRTKAKSKPDAKLVKRGSSLYLAYQCAACHRLNGKGPEDGVPLDGIGSRRDAKFIKEQLKNPEEHVKKHPEAYQGDPNMMPNPDLSAEEINAICSYLLTLKEHKKEK